MTKYGMLIDLKRCAGCYTCLVACQLFNNQKPGISWGKIDVVEWGEEVGSYGRAYIPHACMHCDEPPCVDVCPTGASIHLDDGVVVVDYDACINCGSCYDVCPYEARIPNKVRINYFNAKEPAPYEAYGEQRAAVVEKCNFCHDLVEQGKQPACVYNCPARARFFGDLEDPESDISKRLALVGDDYIRIDETSFYYTVNEGMPAEAIPNKAHFAVPVAPEEPASNEAAIAGGVGAVAVAAAAVGIGVGVKKAKESAPVEVKDNE